MPKRVGAQREGPILSDVVEVCRPEGPKETHGRALVKATDLLIRMTYHGHFGVSGTQIRPYNSDFLFPPPPHPDKPPGRPTPESLIWVHFGSVLRVRLGPFQLCFGSVSGPFRGVGWGRGEGASVREKNITTLQSDPTKTLGHPVKSKSRESLKIGEK